MHLCLCVHRFLERDIVVADRVFNIDSITTASMGQFAVLNTEQVQPSCMQRSVHTVYACSAVYGNVYTIRMYALLCSVEDTCSSNSMAIV
jgi:hypothetical protein